MGISVCEVHSRKARSWRGSTQLEEGQVVEGLLESVLCSDAVAQGLACVHLGKASKPFKTMSLDGNTGD